MVNVFSCNDEGIQQAAVRGTLRLVERFAKNHLDMGVLAVVIEDENGVLEIALNKKQATKRLEQCGVAL